MLLLLLFQIYNWATQSIKVTNQTDKSLEWQPYLVYGRDQNKKEDEKNLWKTIPPKKTKTVSRQKYENDDLDKELFVKVYLSSETETTSASAIPTRASAILRGESIALVDEIKISLDGEKLVVDPADVTVPGSFLPSNKFFIFSPLLIF